MNAAIRVFSVKDHALVREGIAMIINCQPPGMLMVAQASNGREAIAGARIPEGVGGSDAGVSAHPRRFRLRYSRIQAALCALC